MCLGVLPACMSVYCVHGCCLILTAPSGEGVRRQGINSTDTGSQLKANNKPVYSITEEGLTYPSPSTQSVSKSGGIACSSLIGWAGSGTLTVIRNPDSEQEL